MQLSRTNQIIGSALVSGAAALGVIFIFTLAFYYFADSRFTPPTPVNAKSITAGIIFFLSGIVGGFIIGLLKTKKLLSALIATLAGLPVLMVTDLLLSALGTQTVMRPGEYHTLLIGGTIAGILLIPAGIAAAIFTSRTTPNPPRENFTTPTPPPEF